MVRRGLKFKRGHGPLAPLFPPPILDSYKLGVVVRILAVLNLTLTVIRHYYMYNELVKFNL